MKNSIIFLFLIVNFFSFGQNLSINSKVLKSGSIKIDSIEVTISVYRDKIETESFFQKGKFKLNVVYSKIGESYNEIRTSENNLKFKYCYRINVFEFENGKVVNGEENYYLDQSRYEIDGRFEEVKKSYNKNLNSEFLKKYVVELYQKIINYR